MLSLNLPVCDGLIRVCIDKAEYDAARALILIAIVVLAVVIAIPTVNHD